MRKFIVTIILLSFFIVSSNVDADTVTLTFQEGAYYTGTTTEYSGTLDTELAQHNPDIPHGNNDYVTIDYTPVADCHGLLMFTDIFGPLSQGKIPLNLLSSNYILDVTLTLHISQHGLVDADLHRMLQSWDETATWGGNFGGNGIQDDDSEASSIIDATVLGETIPPSADDYILIDVTSSLRAWWENPTANLGWAFLPCENNEDGWVFSSYEATQSLRPELSVTVPEPSSLCLIGLGSLILRRKRWAK
ncbi:MAG: PEP-CTERM sorting domain-containing protein [Sedimentisphaerales bacterium]|nr:PEP-CTERM sorting domain-containing protein [Sedimentisphaerales bacterium]